MVVDAEEIGLQANGVMNAVNNTAMQISLPFTLITLDLYSYLGLTCISDLWRNLLSERKRGKCEGLELCSQLLYVGLGVLDRIC